MSTLPELADTRTRHTAGTRVIEAGAGPTVLLLHGQGGHAENFRYNIPAYAEHFHVVSADLRWHGLSDKTGTPTELIPELVEGVLRLLDEENIDTCLVEGQSLGGWVATRLALEHPDRVRGLVLTTPMGVGAATVTDPQALGEWLASQQRALSDVTIAGIHQRMSALFADPALPDDEIVAIRERIYRDPATNQALRHVAAAYFEPQQAARQSISDAELGTLDLPVLVYWGSHNDPFPPSVGQAIADAVPGARYHCAEVGHWAQYERYQEHNQVVVPFLRSVNN